MNLRVIVVEKLKVVMVVAGEEYDDDLEMQYMD
jgi:hypothetical protein